MSDTTFPRVKLGKLPRRHDSRVLRLARYVNLSQIPEPPPVIVNSRGVKAWGMLGNDIYGDCTICGVAHGVQVAVLSQVDPAFKSPQPIPFDANAVVDYYSKWCGYVRGNEATDQGGCELEVLTRFRNEGFMGHKIRAFVATDPTDLHLLALAHWLFGGVYNGLAMPSAWQGADVWDTGRGCDFDAGSWGGHCTFSVDFNTPEKEVGLITWGSVQPATFRGFNLYADEGYALIFEDWKPPKGFDLDLLEHDVAWVEKQPRSLSWAA